MRDKFIEAFKPEKLREVVGITSKMCLRLFESIDKSSCAQKRSIEVNDELGKLTFNVITAFTLGLDLSDKTPPVGFASFPNVNNYCRHAIYSLF
jgi:cytochrome P450